MAEAWATAAPLSRVESVAFGDLFLTGSLALRQTLKFSHTGLIPCVRILSVPLRVRVAGA